MRHDHPMLADMRRQPHTLAALLARAAEFAERGHASRGVRTGRIYAFGSSYTRKPYHHDYACHIVCA